MHVAFLYASHELAAKDLGGSDVVRDGLRKEESPGSQRCDDGVTQSECVSTEFSCTWETWTSTRRPKRARWTRRARNGGAGQQGEVRYIEDQAPVEKTCEQHQQRASRPATAPYLGRRIRGHQDGHSAFCDLQPWLYTSTSSLYPTAYKSPPTDTPEDHTTPSEKRILSPSPPRPRKPIRRENPQQCPPTPTAPQPARLAALPLSRHPSPAPPVLQPTVPTRRPISKRNLPGKAGAAPSAHSSPRPVASCPTP